jgi:hypothetical protein
MNDTFSRMQYFDLTSPPYFADEILVPSNKANFQNISPYIFEEERSGSASVDVFREIGVNQISILTHFYLNQHCKLAC